MGSWIFLQTSHNSHEAIHREECYLRVCNRALNQLDPLTLPDRRQGALHLQQCCLSDQGRHQFNQLRPKYSVLQSSVVEPDAVLMLLQFRVASGA